jgi:hypothetical protein
MQAHPLLNVYVEAARGRFPPPDGGVTFLPVDTPGIEAIVAFTGHAFVLSDLGPADFADIELDGFGLAQRPEAQLRIARGGRIGVLDATMVWLPGPTSSSEAGSVAETHHFDDHPRVRHARSIRTDVRVFACDEGLITLSRGLAGRQEMGVAAFSPGQGTGGRLIRSAQAVSDPTSPLFAAVAPGNARSFRAFQAEGFSVVGSEIVIEVDG